MTRLVVGMVVTCALATGCAGDDGLGTVLGGAATLIDLLDDGPCP